MYFFRLFSLLLLAVVVSHAADAPHKLAFSRDDGIYVANVDGSGARKLAKGSWPRISPDGTRVAFNTESQKTPARSIAVVDVESGKVTTFSGISSDNSYGPVWSPDGSKIIFSTLIKHEWQLGIIDADGSHYRQFEPKSKVGMSLNSVAWAPDGQSFYAQDLDNLYRFALDGSLKEKRSLAKFIPGGSFSSGARFEPSADGGVLLLDADMDEDVKRKDWDGPAPAIWVVELASGKATRITPKGFLGWSPTWLNPGEILCTVFPDKSKQRAIYRLSADGKKRDLWIKNAENPSVSR